MGKSLTTHGSYVEISLLLEQLIKYDLKIFNTNLFRFQKAVFHKESPVPELECW